MVEVLFMRVLYHSLPGMLSKGSLFLRFFLVLPSIASAPVPEPMHEDRPQEASDIVSEVVLWALLGIVRI